MQSQVGARPQELPVWGSILLVNAPRADRVAPYPLGEPNMFQKLVLAAFVATLGACTTASPDVVQRYDTQHLAQVQDGTVLSIRPVTIDGSQSGVGAGAGAVVGGIAGSSVGGHRESAIVGVLGAVLGGVIGNAAERTGTKENGVEIVIQLRNGERRAIVQTQGTEVIAPGDAVVLVTTGGKTRVTRAPAVAPAPQS
jgi:outer membrane lipoprotein SlyB